MCHVLSEVLMHLPKSFDKTYGNQPSPWFFLYSPHCSRNQLGCQEDLTLMRPHIRNEVSLEAQTSKGCDWSPKNGEENEVLNMEMKWATGKWSTQTRFWAEAGLCPSKQRVFLGTCGGWCFVCFSPDTSSRATAGSLAPGRDCRGQSSPAASVASGVQANKHGVRNEKENKQEEVKVWEKVLEADISVFHWVTTCPY